MAADKNPWSVENWNLTGQAEYVRKFGVARAEARARDAGTVLGARPPIVPTTRRYIEGTFIFQRDIVEDA